MFVFTLYLQVSQHDSALRAGLTYLPLATTFGVISFYWRRLPGRVHGVLAPAGLAVTGLGCLLLPVSAYAGLALIGSGLGFAVGPLFNRSLATGPGRGRVRCADTTVQLGQLTGVAAVGSPVHPSHHPHPGRRSRRRRPPLSVSRWRHRSR